LSDKIYSSAPSEPDDDFWLEEGKRMVTESLGSVRNAANSLTASLGMLQSFYLGILSLGQALPAQARWWEKALFVAPMMLWLLALYLCIAVVMTKKLEVFVNSPSDVREKSMQMLLQKQRQLQWAMILLAAGLVGAFMLFFRQL
jgi:hypothetical protein